MTADYFTKPLQGGLLKYTGALLIMGLVARPFPVEEQTVGKGDEKRAGKMSKVNAKMSTYGVTQNRRKETTNRECSNCVVVNTH